MKPTSGFKSHFDELKNIKYHYLDHEDEEKEMPITEMSRTKKRIGDYSSREVEKEFSTG